MVAYTIFQVHATYVTLKIALNIQVNVSNMPICMLAQVYVLLLTMFTNFKNSFNNCLEL